MSSIPATTLDLTKRMISLPIDEAEDLSTASSATTFPALSTLGDALGAVKAYAAGRSARSDGAPVRHRWMLDRGRKEGHCQVRIAMQSGLAWSRSLRPLYQGSSLPSGPREPVQCVTAAVGLR